MYDYQMKEHFTILQNDEHIMIKNKIIMMDTKKYDICGYTTNMNMIEYDMNQTWNKHRKYNRTMKKNMYSIIPPCESKDWAHGRWMNSLIFRNQSLTLIQVLPKKCS